MICELYRVFSVWAKGREFDPYLNIDADGKGWIGDGVGGTFFEFDTIAEAIEQISVEIEEGA